MPKSRESKEEESILVQYAMTVEKRDVMKHQAQLRHERTVAYKTGNEEMRK